MNFNKGYVRFNPQACFMWSPPSVHKACDEDEDYFTLIKFCWDCIAEAQESIKLINLYDKKEYLILESLSKCVKELFKRINECYDYLKALGSNVASMDVYTTSLAHKGTFNHG